ncbi:putative Multiprotein-bridging factor 1a [Blattamonas nauphoetae]|uniref:Multiprotein-bridging factor 1a n=1 Tax=Blattamonas nauphoetae TaxID=2049346 RepID=A0ABQ9YLQ4_9EUKA|nr:putative Multiprotein-bridging factor 1a [Blattamonas nauphoetae]
MPKKAKRRSNYKLRLDRKVMEQDWTPTVITRNPTRTKTVKSNADIRDAQQQGLELEASKKFTGGKNTSGRNHPGHNDLRKIENDDGETVIKVKTITRGQALAIQQARTEKKMTQAQLAQRINEPVKIINEYEQQKGTPNQQILSKLERVLGVKLRGI